MIQRWRGPVIAVTAALLVLVIGADISLSRARRPNGRRELHRQETQVKRARRVTKRILKDRRASDAIKQQAQELDGILSEREQMIKVLENLHRDFVAQHKADIDQLGLLRRQALEIDNRLREDRKQVMAAHAAEVETLVAGAERAEQLIGALVTEYNTHKRERRAPRRQQQQQ